MWGERGKEIEMRGITKEVDPHFCSFSAKIFWGDHEYKKTKYLMF